MVEIESERLWFLRGVMAALASSGQVADFAEIRRLCRFTAEQARAYLRAAGRGQYEDEPDFRDIVLDEGGCPREGVDPRRWSARLHEAQRYWRDRRNLDDDGFRREWGDTPTFPARLSRVG